MCVCVCVCVCVCQHARACLVFKCLECVSDQACLTCIHRVRCGRRWAVRCWYCGASSRLLIVQGATQSWQSDYFPLNNVGSGVHCLRSFLLFLDKCGEWSSLPAQFSLLWKKIPWLTWEVVFTACAVFSCSLITVGRGHHCLRSSLFCGRRFLDQRGEWSSLPAQFSLVPWLLWGVVITACAVLSFVEDSLINVGRGHHCLRSFLLFLDYCGEWSSLPAQLSLFWKTQFGGKSVRWRCRRNS